MLKLGELFCGPGGMALGAKLATLKLEGKTCSISHEWASDYDATCCETYVKNITSEGLVICKDVGELEIDKLPKIDCFAYGFPCDDFSIVGEHKGLDGTTGPHYSYGVKVLDSHKPLFFIGENVGGITSANEGKAFPQILKELEKGGNGYHLTVHKYNAADYGVPQSRNRYVIVGIDKTLGLKFKVPSPTHKSSHISSKEALEVPPIPADAKNHEFTRHTKSVIERLRHTKPGENAWTATLPKHLRLNVKKTRLSQIYKRLEPDKPAYTITGKGGGGTHCYHWEEPRALTNRERARLQSFPDDFEFFGSKENVRAQVGYAVPPLLSKMVFEAVFKTLEGVDYDSIKANYSWPNKKEV
mgnify:CR=1 FL=1